MEIAATPATATSDNCDQLSIRAARLGHDDLSGHGDSILSLVLGLKKLFRHSDEDRKLNFETGWMPACAGMTD